MQGDIKYVGSISMEDPREGHGNALQYLLENPTERGALVGYRAANSQTQLKQLSFSR